MRLCVYTSLFGGYDRLLDQPVAADSDADFICFTDDPTLTSESWDVRVVTSALAADTVRSARLVKILGHPSLDEYDVTLYIDASILLRAAPEEIVRAWLPEGVDMALAGHSYRERLVDEFDEVIRLMYEDQARVYEQLTDYAVAHPDVLDAQPLWTGMIVRRTGDAIQPAMRTWANHVLRYSRRDQLSVLVALEGARFAVNVIALDNFSSDSHEWPVIEGRRTALGKTSAVPTGPLLADLMRARSEVESLTSEIARAESEIQRAASEAAQAASVHVEELTRSLAGVQHEAALRSDENMELRKRIDEAEGRAFTAETRLTHLEASLSELTSVSGAVGNMGRAVVRRVRRR